jgi:hypothetical protein
MTLGSRNTKLRLYKTLIRPTILYGSQTWTMTTNAIRIFERKFVRKVYGHVEVREQYGE